MQLKWIILGGLASLATPYPAQTQFAPATRTNILCAAPNFREVDGQLYNTSYSQLWHSQQGKVTDVEAQGVVLQTFITNNVYESIFVPGQGTPGTYSGTSDHYERRLVSSDLVPEKRIFINNYHIGAVDQDIVVRAMKTGTIQVGETTLEKWDCGKPHYVTNIIMANVQAP